MPCLMWTPAATNLFQGFLKKKYSTVWEINISMKKQTLLKNFLYLVFVIASATSCANASTLLDNFQNPPRESKPQTWWHWFGGHVSKEGITRDLEAMKRVGIGGVQNFHVNIDTPEGPIPYDSPQWHDLIKHAISEAARLDLEYGFHNCAGWSSTGGPWIEPKHAMKQVVWSEHELDAGSGKQPLKLTLKKPIHQFGFYRDIAVVAFPKLKHEQKNGESWLIENWQQKSFMYPHAKLTITPDRLIRDTRSAPQDAIIAAGEILDLSQYQNGDELIVPASELKKHSFWTVIRFGYTATTAKNSPSDKAGEGLECDKMSTEAVDVHWDHLIVSIKKDAGKHEETFTNVLVDSFEKNYQNWTQGFERAFSSAHAYEITKWLPAMTGRVINSVDETERFLWDLRKTCADMINQNYFGHLAQRAHADNLYLAVEPYGMGNFDEMGAALLVDMPMGEFWAHSDDERTPRLASSAGNIMGRKFIGAESFTAHAAPVWTTNPKNMKARSDYFLSKGINRFIYHTYVHQPWADTIKPGMNMGRFGFNFNRNNTWFEQSKPFLTYIARAQSLLQAGRASKDILYVYGECVPTQSQKDADIRPSVPGGYDFDKAGHQVLKMAEVQNGKIVFPSGMQYSILVLTHAERTTPEFLQEIHRLAKAGATIIAKRPSAAPGLKNYPNCDVLVGKYGNELWGQGLVRESDDLKEVLMKQGIIPDFTCDPANGILYSHRIDGNTDIYFVANTTTSFKELSCTFRVSGKMPEIWDPETGETSTAPVWHKNREGSTTVQLFPLAGQSLFVVFRQTTPPSHIGIVKAEFKPSETADRTGVLTAIYGILDDTEKQADVTQKIQQALHDENVSVQVSNQLCGHDPAEGQKKALRVEGFLNGKKIVLTADEGQSLDISKLQPAGTHIAPIRCNQQSVAVYLPGKLRLTRSDGELLEHSSNGGSVSGVHGPWDVTYGEYGPKNPVRFSKLIPWNEHPDDSIKYYSGTAVYKTTFTYTKDQAAPLIMLDLGQVHDIVTVILNGENLGVLWKKPYWVSVRDALKSGKNDLELHVTNLAVNRIIGDEQSPEISVKRKAAEPKGQLETIPEWVVRGDKHPDKGRNYFFTFRYYEKDSPLLDSGLIGPVRLIEPDMILLK